METELGEIKGFKTESVKFDYRKPVEYFEYKPCNMRISVYSKIRLFKRIMIRYFFGLKYVKL